MPLVLVSTGRGALLVLETTGAAGSFDVHDTVEEAIAPYAQ
ncbi:hypothetical protein [Streptomyces sp. NPDC059918]